MLFKKQENKFSKLLKECQPKQDLEKVSSNYSDASLPEAQQFSLVKGLKFPIQPKNLTMLIKRIYYLDNMSNCNFDFFKKNIKDAALTSLYNSNLYFPLTYRMMNFSSSS